MDVIRIDQEATILDGSIKEEDAINMFSHICSTPYGNGLYDHNKTVKIIEHCVKEGHLSILEHANITLKCRTNIATYKDYTRHRHCAFTIESTAFNKYEGDVEVITVSPLEDTERHALMNLFYAYRNHTSIKIGRDFLPQCCAATMVMTTNIREWRYIIGTRGAPNENPSTVQLRNLIWIALNEKYPFFFPIDKNGGTNPMTIYDTWGHKRPTAIDFGIEP
jgi:thymidylate synthase (FAD)